MNKKRPQPKKPVTSPLWTSPVIVAGLFLALIGAAAFIYIILLFLPSLPAPSLTTIGGIFAFIVILLTAFTIITARIRMKNLEDVNQMLRRETIRLTQSLSGDKPAPNKESAVNEKMSKFLNIASVSFHYADEVQIKNFYSDYFREPTIESMVSEMVAGVSGNIKASVPQILESQIGSKDISKWVSTIKLPDTSLSGMFIRYQRETIKNAQVTLGIEEVDIELTDLQEFDKIIEFLRVHFKFEIEGHVLQPQRAHLREKAAERTLKRLEQITGAVLVEGLFKIEKNAEGFYRLVYSHPVTEYLSKQPSPITISVLVSASALAHSVAGNYAQAIDQSIPLRVYGQIWKPISRKSHTMDLQIIPLAIY